MFWNILEQLGNSWGTVGEQLGNSWGTVREQLGNIWGTFGEHLGFFFPYAPPSYWRIGALPGPKLDGRAYHTPP
jgi:hypothetical protein